MLDFSDINFSDLEYSDFDLPGINELIMPELKSRVNTLSSIFEFWFGGLRLIYLSDKKAIFQTPTNLRKNILNNKHIPLIREVLEEITACQVEVVLCSLPELRAMAAEDPRINKLIYIDDEAVKEEAQKERRITDYINSSPEKEIEKPVEKEKIDSDEDTDTKDSPTVKKSTLEEYTFDNFVEGSSNKFARAACYAVAREPNSYNPLFIYGHSGLGKTHLLYAVINYMRKNHPHLKIVYKRCETFLDELIKAIKSGSTATFKEKYRSADVLLIDDVQFLAGKEQTQEEFFHTFSVLYESDRQIILTSDRPPKEIKPLEDRLRTRFEGGLLADVQPPSFELRLAIIKKKADTMGLSISNEIIEYMAERLQNNIRQIEGVLKRIHAIYSLTSAEVTREKVDEVISIIDPGNIPTDTLIERILFAVGRSFGVSPEDMKSKKRTDNIASARHAAIYIIKQLTELTLKEIGAVFDRDHATVISSIEKAEKNMKTVNNYEAEIERLMKEIRGGA
ncbi:MAG: chromosomal replication initiator protein DnaA [Clostridia bacterium]|nr:chromosomal replication initiator protein DnaA [Clostridia bacterium]